MATERSFVEYIQSQSGWGHELAFKKMFGEYALYLHGKVVAFACGNQLYLKPTEEGRSLLKTVSEHPPYPGAKLYFRIDEQMEDRELLRKVFETTARALPLPKPKATTNTTASPVRAKGKVKGEVTWRIEALAPMRLLFGVEPDVQAGERILPLVQHRAASRRAANPESRAREVGLEAPDPSIGHGRHSGPVPFAAPLVSNVRP